MAARDVGAAAGVIGVLISFDDTLFGEEMENLLKISAINDAESKLGVYRLHIGINIKSLKKIGYIKIQYLSNKRM
jgi:hypothetical protein